jgi:hypothetical protein
MQRDYILTHSNRRVYLPDADPESIDIGDVAHALSLNCRFAGHIPYHYSVCEHSINVYEYCLQRTEDRTILLQALLHDATEAYIADIATPFKALLPDYKILEANLWETIANKFGVPVVMHPLVKEADRVLLMTEKDFLRPGSEPWPDVFESIPRWERYPTTFFNPSSAQEEFLRIFNTLHIE